MSFSYHKGGVNRPVFSGGQLATAPIPSGSPANNALAASRPVPSLPPDVSRVDVVIISMHRNQAPAPRAALQPNGLVVFDETAMRQAVAQGPAFLPVLEKALRQHSVVLSSPKASNDDLLKTLYTLQTAERLADSGVSIDSLYPALSTLDSIPNPLLTIYLAGAYSKLTRPEPLGWALMTLARLGTQQALGGVPTPHLQKAHEEVGKVVSFQLQKFPALAVQVMGWLQTFGSQTISGPLNLSTLKVH